MGTTSKGLRYPEPSVLGNTLHTRIKELAEDANGVLVTDTARIAALENTVNIRGLPITRHGSHLPTSTNLPNNDAWQTTHLVQNIVVIPATAVTVHVSMKVSAHCVVNAQAHWDPQISLNNGSVSWLKLAPSNLTSHNQAQPALNMGFAVSGIFDVQAARGQTIALALNGKNDVGSGAWVHVGYLQWSVTTMS